MPGPSSPPDAPGSVSQSELKPVVGKRRVGRYQLLGLIGTGGMAEVFLAKQDGPAGFSKTVVIKRTLPRLASDPRFIEMFQREARVAAQLNHSNIVQVFELGEDDGVHFIAMEHVVGLTLQRLGRALRLMGTTFPIELALAATADAALGLHHAHTLVGEDGRPLGLVHRDISPDNLMINREAVTKILDFGIAKGTRGREETSSHGVKGKVAFMPPEQIRGEPLDGRTDLYALGVTLFGLLTGKRPFRAASDMELMERVLTDAPPSPRALNPKIPERVDELILALLEKDRANRPATGDDVHAALAPLLPPRRELAPIVEAAMAARQDARGATPLDPESDGPELPGALPLAQVEPSLISADAVPQTRPLAETNPTSELAGAAVVPRARVARYAAALIAAALLAAALGVGLLLLSPPGAVEVAAGDVVTAPPPPVTPPGPPPADLAPSPPTPTAAASVDTVPVASQPPAPPVEQAVRRLRVQAPAQVRWIVDGKTLARGSATLSVPAQTKKLTARDSERDVDTEIALAAGQTSVDYAALPLGALDVRAFPHAEVYGGTVHLGTAPLPHLPAIAGRHRLRLVNGAVVVTRTVVVKPGETAQVRADLSGATP